MNRDMIITAFALSVIVALLVNEQRGKQKENRQKNWHAVIVTFSIPTIGISAVQQLGNELRHVIKSSTVGEYDGHETGKSKVTLYMYGPDAKKLFKVVEPVFKKSEFKPFDVKLRMGPADKKSLSQKLTI